MTVELKPKPVKKPITVSRLLEWCQAAIREGHSERYILMSSDDECNSFHPAWEGFSIPRIEDMDYIDTPIKYDIDKIIILS